MKAAILEELNAPLVIDEIEPMPLECGQVLVAVKKSGICGAQIGEIAGVKGPDKYLPHLVGHEGGGIVIDVGPGVTHVKSSNHVVMHWRKGIGIESAPPKYKRGDGYVGAGWVTTFNEYAVVSENRLTVIDDDIPFEIAALMGCAVTTALGLVNNEAQLKIGQSIAVIGCGGVGLNIIQGAAMVSACPIIAVDCKNLKLQMAWKFGTNYTINSSGLTPLDFRDEIQKIVGKRGIDVFVDCTGRVDLIEAAYELTAPGGKTIMVGQPDYSQCLGVEHMLKNFTGKTLTDSQGGQTNPTEDIPRYLDLYRTGKLKLDELITHSYPLDKVNEALDMVKSGEAGRCILNIT